MLKVVDLLKKLLKSERANTIVNDSKSVVDLVGKFLEVVLEKI